MNTTTGRAFRSAGFFTLTEDLNMLVLSRKATEIIRIGDDITITILKSGHIVKIGIEAPRGVVILRGELSNDLDTCIGSENLTAGVHLSRCCRAHV